MSNIDTTKLREICLAAMPDRAKSEADIFAFQNAFQIHVCLFLLDELEAVRRARDEACDIAAKSRTTRVQVADGYYTQVTLRLDRDDEARISTLRAVGVRP